MHAGFAGCARSAAANRPSSREAARASALQLVGGMTMTKMIRFGALLSVLTLAACAVEEDDAPVEEELTVEQGDVSPRQSEGSADHRRPA